MINRCTVVSAVDQIIITIRGTVYDAANEWHDVIRPTINELEMSYRVTTTIRCKLFSEGPLVILQSQNSILTDIAIDYQQLSIKDFIELESDVAVLN